LRELTQRTCHFLNYFRLSDQIISLDVIQDSDDLRAEIHQKLDRSSGEKSKHSSVLEYMPEFARAHFCNLKRETFILQRQAEINLANQLNKKQEYAAKIVETLVQAGRKVSLGYGMHFGWAIEGAIGSNLKIDASYLSPHGKMNPN
jgi:hypothetical protein